jgi:hypothetical protein
VWYDIYIYIYIYDIRRQRVTSTCFGRQASFIRRHYTSSFWCELRALVAVGWLQLWVD